MGMTPAERQRRYRAKDREAARARARAQSKKFRAENPATVKASLKAWYSARREKIAAQRKAERLTNGDAIRAAQNARRAKNKERINAQRKAWRLTNLERVRQIEALRRAHPEKRAKAVARTAKWAREHPEQWRLLQNKQDAKRRAIERNVFVETVDSGVVFERDKGMCGICLKPVDRNSKWHVDHIVPIAKGGLHSYANVQLAHGRCNISKGAKCVSA